MKKELRPYQQKGVADLRTAYANGHRRVCYQAPTGSGKTILFTAIIDGATARGNRTLILGHRQEISEQIDVALTDLGLEHGFIAAGYPENPDAPVQIASVATLVRRLDRLGDIDLIVVDECFPAGTLIDGMPIECLRVGDFVRSFNHEIGCIERCRITQVFCNQPKHLVTVRLCDGRAITCTANHPFYTPHGYVAAAALSSRSEVLSNTEWARVDSVEVHQQASDGGFGGLCRDGLVYNIEVEGNHNYFVDDVLVHNCHHCPASSYLKILAAAGALPDAEIGGGLGLAADHKRPAILGVTATPERLDGKGLDDIFDHLVIGPTVEELIAEGWLAKPICFAPAKLPNLSGIKTRMGDYEIGALGDRMGKPIVIQSAVDEYERLCNGAPAIAFAVDIRHSQQVVAAFQARGIRAAHIDGDTPKDERRRILAALATGEIQVVGNCGLISEGLDVPGVHAAILLRPTKSLALHLQQVGRALRPAPGKDKAKILDCEGNVFEHGPPDAPHAWSLAGRDKETERAERELQRRCPECGAIIPLGSWHCLECGAVLREPVPGRVEVETHLVPAERLAVMTYQQALLWAGRSEARLRLVAQARGYKRGWVWHVLQNLGGAT
jgi:superfamily II DNA or RNA helicase